MLVKNKHLKEMNLPVHRRVNKTKTENKSNCCYSSIYFYSFIFFLFQFVFSKAAFTISNLSA